MFNTLSILSIALVAASSVSGLIIPRHRNVNVLARAEPGTYDAGYLEGYEGYHARYIAIGCNEKHNTTFFDTCCHPLLATETLKADRPAECAPSAASLASASSALPTTTIKPDSNGNNCEDPADTTTTPTPKATPTPEASPKQHHTPKNATVTESSTHTSSAPETKATSKSSSKSSSSSGSGSSSALSGTVQSGGVATFFTQNGVAGACGTVHSDSDFICAIDQQRYGNSGGKSKLCGMSIRIVNTNNGKSVTCQIADDCPTCKNENSVDLSVGAFTAIATQAEGEVPIQWSFQ
jgi:hypothetical protein